MTYSVTIQKKKKWFFSKPIKKEDVEVLGEDMYWALNNAIIDYSKHDILTIK